MNSIKKYWENNAIIHGASHWASWGDSYAIDLEVDCVSKYIHDGDNVLDVGCANGYSTIQQYKKRPSIYITGIDYSEEMIKAARVANIGGGDIEFAVGDIRGIGYADETFDTVYTTRVLINLPTWEEQKQGIRECLRVTKKGGVVVLSEGFWEPLVKLNAMRMLCGLHPLNEHDFNRYLKQSKLHEFLANIGLSWEVDEFSAVYYLGSRLLRELLLDVTKYEGYENPINKLFHKLSDTYKTSGFGIQIAYVIRKNR